MNKKQFLQIAKSGFPDRVKESINFEELEMIHSSGSYWLYDKNAPFITRFPKESVITISFERDNFVQIRTGYMKFNHYAAIKEMEKLGLV